MACKDLDSIYNDALSEAAMGKGVWLGLVDKYGLGPKGAALLLPYQTPRYHEASVKLLPEYMEKMNIDTGVILWERGKEFPNWLDEKGLKSRSILIHMLSKEEMDALMRFYSFYEFTDKLIIGSLELPPGRLGTNMIGKKGLSLEEAVGVMLYDICR